MVNQTAEVQIDNSKKIMFGGFQADNIGDLANRGRKMSLPHKPLNHQGPSNSDDITESSNNQDVKQRHGTADNVMNLNSF